ncbi:BREX-1 system adenine-specific DNA-methyltransferase PglX [Geomonas propionica]|uniref:site-specific DNA-methyltransferase (adenine-specific) n=1 Tax=Geomonas propionica TaxID=2798582 RepID=A0ABS0YP34_9BACT|nr:BREX-1 system adenine-specific DNA-methyltransferase PglX [Geomonas propionica]MBJ6799740.1 BREX-1 system adenine-specific DNA-methyltransferase PglX [Geomonas propionica]
MDKETRNALQRATQAARRLLEHEYSKQLEGIYDILQDGTIAPQPGGHLDAQQRLTREKIVAAIQHKQAGGLNPTDAINDYLREAAFTTLNRFVALKMLEARKLVQQCISNGDQSAGFKEFTGLAPGLASLPDKGYRLYLECLFDEIGNEVKVLFDRRDVASLLWPRRLAFNELLQLLNNNELGSVWDADETIGWVYQYFNPKEEREAMRKASRSPRNTRELAVRNQFFTPRYVVEFLTDNTLGRIWYEMMHGSTNLTNICTYMVRRPSEIFLKCGETAPDNVQKSGVSQSDLLKQPTYIPFRKKKDPRDIKVLDPAGGSGHFLLYGFDLLQIIYEEAWKDDSAVSSETTGNSLRKDYSNIEALRHAIPSLILQHNLHGIDIDPRAAQIASLSLWMRAQRSYNDFGIARDQRPSIKKTNFVVAEPMPGQPELLEEFVSGLTPKILGQLVMVVFKKMQLAGEAGSLLKIEEEINDAIAEAKDVWQREYKQAVDKKGNQLLFSEKEMGGKVQAQLTLFDVSDISEEQFWDKTEQLLINALHSFAKSATDETGLKRRLFADDAERGFAFVDLCRKKFDVVLMNPPFGASSKASKSYIDSIYFRTKGDLLANFIERMLGMTHADGKVAAISSRTPFFLGSFAGLRTNVLGHDGYVSLLADLGDGVLDAMVETATYVISKGTRNSSESDFIRALLEDNKDDVLKAEVESIRQGQASERVFLIAPEEFSRLKGSPYAYWVMDETIQTLGDFPQLEGNKASIRVGLQTGEDNRHLRLLWEIPNSKIVPQPITFDRKGGSLRQRCLYELEDKGMWVPFSKTESAAPWFSPITLAVNWNSNGFEIKNFADDKGKIRSRPQNESYYLEPGFSYMLRSTRLVPYLVPSGVIPTAGRAQIFPDSGEEYTVLGICASNIGSAVARFSGEMFARPKFQASMVQNLPLTDLPKATINEIKAIVDEQVNTRRAVIQGYEPFQEFTIPAWIQSPENDSTAWDLYSLLGRTLEAKVAEAFHLDPDQLYDLERDIREAVQIRSTSPDTEADDDPGEDEDSDDEAVIELIQQTPEEKAFGFMSYCVGCCYGRWDVRMAMDSSLAPKLPQPFDPLPASPPGMLIAPDGLPAQSDTIVSDEWLRARPDANTLPAKGSISVPTITQDDYPLKISWSGILVEDKGHADDIEASVQRVFNTIWGNKSVEEIDKVLAILAPSTDEIRPWLRAQFFSEHIKRYSKSRRKAPIYWCLSIPSKGYSVWLYYHRFNKDTLFKVLNDYVVPKLQLEERKLSTLRAEIGDSPTAGQRKLIADQETLTEELKTFREEVAMVAPLWNPDLNDGVLINFALLWRLVPHIAAWQKECKQIWDALVKGEYDWTHLAMHLWPERVVLKCRKDLSHAIAHGLENDLWELDEDEKWQPKDVSQNEIDAFVAERSSRTVKDALEKLLAAPVAAGGGRRRRS